MFREIIKTSIKYWSTVYSVSKFLFYHCKEHPCLPFPLLSPSVVSHFYILRPSDNKQSFIKWKITKKKHETTLLERFATDCSLKNNKATIKIIIQSIHNNPFDVSIFNRESFYSTIWSELCVEPALCLLRWWNPCVCV